MIEGRGRGDASLSAVTLGLMLGAALACDVGTVPGTSMRGLAEGEFPVLRGAYLGQVVPGEEPEVFAPGVVSTGMYERDITISRDGQEIYYGLMTGGLVTIMATRLVDGRWTEPEVASFARDLRYYYFEPCLAADGSRILFLCTRPPAGQEPKARWGHQNIWAADRLGDGSWGDPYDLGEPINTESNEYYPSLTGDGALYFTRSPADDPLRPVLYRSRFFAGRYAEPEALPDAVNGNGNPYNAFVAPDESALIACVAGRDDAAKGEQAKYYVFFRGADDVWSHGVSLGEKVNIAGVTALSASVSPCGRYLFFASSRAPDFAVGGRALTLGSLLTMHGRPENGSSDIYWVDAGIIEDLRQSSDHRGSAGLR